MVTITVVLDKRIVKKDGTYPLNFRIYQDLADLQSKLILADDEQIQQYLAPKQIIPFAPACLAVFKNANAKKFFSHIQVMLLTI